MIVDHERPAVRTPSACLCVLALALASLVVWRDVFWLLLSLYALVGGFGAAFVIARVHRQRDLVELGRDVVRARARTVWIATLATGVLTCMMIATVPPFQSPDAGTHAWRAYSLFDNRVLLRPATQAHPVNQLLDPGLFAYTRQWTRRLAFQPEKTVDAAFADAADAIPWSGRNEPNYSAAVIYFPALYAPGAAALGIGRAVRSSVGDSYLAARLAMGAAATLAVLLALMSTRAGFFTMCVVAILPMTLCQFAGATLDTMTISMGLLVAALTTCGAYGSLPGRVVTFSPIVLIGAWLLMAMLVVTKPVFLVYLVYPAWCALRGQWRAILPPLLACLACVVAWQLHVGRNYFEPRIVIEGTPLSNMFDALAAPIDTLSLIARSAWEGRGTYWTSMIGVLGWLDTPMSGSAYVIASGALVAAASFDAVSRNPLGATFRALVLLAAAGYFVGVFLFLMVAWTPAVSAAIVGVQGRYFLQVLPMAAMAFGLSRDIDASRRLQPVFAAGLVVYGVWSFWYLHQLVLERYWQ